MTHLLAFLFLATAPAAPPYEIVSPAEVEALLGRPGVVILDLNVPTVWEDHHLPGAIHVDGPELARFLPADRGATLVLYCYSPECTASDEAAREAARLGYRDVRVMREGIRGWVKAGKRFESE
jgi:rhodanese-related sulfurtransferase